MKKKTKTQMINIDKSKTKPLKCTLHAEYNLKYLYILDKTKNPFRCFGCMRTNDLPLADIIHFKEIIESSREDVRKFLYNFPPTSSSTV